MCLNEWMCELWIFVWLGLCVLMNLWCMMILFGEIVSSEVVIITPVNLYFCSDQDNTKCNLIVHISHSHSTPDSLCCCNKYCVVLLLSLFGFHWFGWHIFQDLIDRERDMNNCLKICLDCLNIWVVWYLYMAGTSEPSRQLFQ